METHIRAGGQILLPAAARKKLGITQSTHIHIDVGEAKRQVILTPITREFVHSLRGKYKGKGLLKSLVAEKSGRREKPVSLIDWLAMAVFMACRVVMYFSPCAPDH